MSGDVGLTASDRAVLERLDDVWVTFREIDGPLPRRLLVGRLQSLKARGLVGYREPDDTAGVARVGEWAITERGDQALGRG